MLLGSQGEHADYCKATDSVALTEVDAGFHDKRDLLTEHLRVVSGAGKCGAVGARYGEFLGTRARQFFVCIVCSKIFMLC